MVGGEANGLFCDVESLEKEERVEVFVEGDDIG